MGIWCPSVTAREVHATHNENHSAISGNPTYNAKIAILYTDLATAVSELLGGPQIWPKPTTSISFPVCVHVNVDNDTGRYTTDSNGETINYDKYALLNCVYMARIGTYREDSNGEDVFWMDEVEPRIETRPMNHEQLRWGNFNGVGVPSELNTLAPDEAPPKYENGSTLIHTIEGWDIDYSDLDDLIHTVHNADYTSPIDGHVFEAGTLMLRNYSKITHYNFKSYRHGAYSNTLKLIYETKLDWNVFWRIDLINHIEGYYPIHQASGPYPRVSPFPLVSHNKYLG